MVWSFWFYPYTPRCVSTLYSVLSRDLWKKSQAFYSGGIRTHDPCNSRAVSYQIMVWLGGYTKACSMGYNIEIVHILLYLQSIKKRMYGSTEAFLLDAKWILHNCIVFNGCKLILKDYVLFPNTKHNVHRFTLNLHSLKIMIVESFPWNFTYWGAVVFEKWVKQIIFVSVLACKNVLTSYAMVLV